MPRIDVTRPIRNPRARWYKPWVPLYTSEVIGYVEYTAIPVKGEAGFTEIYYKGEPFDPDQTPSSVHIVEDGGNFLFFNPKDIVVSETIKKGYDKLK